MKRKIIKIDEKKCNGCGLCIPNCPEGALQVIDGKARLISDIFCDGLGACIGHCPQGAIKVVERDAEKYNEKKVMENIVKQGKNTIKAHLEHLKDHGEENYLKEALEVLKKKKIANPLKDLELSQIEQEKHFSGCPGSRMMNFNAESNEKESDNGKLNGKRPSQLRQWPVQLHLVSPMAPYFAGKDVLLAADCTAYALGDFHKDYLKGKSLVIACPKLDSEQEVYAEKLAAMIKDAKINTLTVLIMEVPCCGGLLQIAQEAREASGKIIPIKAVTVGIQGNIVCEEWV